MLLTHQADNSNQACECHNCPFYVCYYVGWKVQAHVALRALEPCW